MSVPRPGNPRQRVNSGVYSGIRKWKTSSLGIYITERLWSCEKFSLSSFQSYVELRAHRYSKINAIKRANMLTNYKEKQPYGKEYKRLGNKLKQATKRISVQHSYKVSDVEWIECYQYITLYSKSSNKLLLIIDKKNEKIDYSRDFHTISN